jgi:hypothetical protein
VQKKIFSLASAQGKKSERKCRKRFSLLRSGEKESAEKDFSLASAQGKKSERKCRKRFSLLRSGEKEKEDRKRKREGEGWLH